MTGVQTCALPISLLAFGSAYYFSEKLKEHYTSHASNAYQLLIAGAVIGFCTVINLIPDLTIIDAVIEGPSQFILEFGRYTQPFFMGLMLLFVMTFVNLVSIKRNSSRIRRTRINYMILGMTIFMASTAIIQLGFTFFLNDFSLTWLPPALSVSEMLFMGYAILASRFYSFRYLCLIGLSVVATALCYTFVIGLLNPLSFADISAWVAAIMAIGLSWPYVSRFIRTCLSYLLYGSPLTPTERIARLEEEFQKSPSKAIESLAHYLGVPSDELKLLDDYQGANLYRTYFENDSTPLVIDEIEDSINKPNNAELTSIHSNMNQMNSALVLPIYEGKNKLSHVLVSSHKQDNLNFSVEELKALERVLQKVQAHINYEQRLRQSQALANSIAHEMRNPLTQVQLEFESLSQRLQYSDDPQALLQHVNKGQQAIIRGRQLIDIILREVNSSSLDQEPSEITWVHRVIYNAVNQYGFDNDNDLKRVALNLSQDFVVKINDTLFSFVLFNLLRNATYYFDSYPNSTIEIHTETDQFENHVVFRDTGPGIPSDLLTRIFDDFFSHDKSGGSGLGLGYCQRVMASFGGKISCQSELNRFTEFKLTFPKTNQVAGRVKEDQPVFKPSVSTAQPETTPIARNLEVESSHTILVVDDKEVQRTLVKIYLEQLGYGVILANNGQVAIEIIKNNPIDLVFMDIQMPVMNGFEASKIIKRTYPTIPIIALSGESAESDLIRISELMDGRLSKPTTKQALSSILTSTLKTPEHA